jgi:hypothetical protein
MPPTRSEFASARQGSLNCSSGLARIVAPLGSVVGTDPSVAPAVNVTEVESTQQGKYSSRYRSQSGQRNWRNPDDVRAQPNVAVTEALVGVSPVRIPKNSARRRRSNIPTASKLAPLSPCLRGDRLGLRYQSARSYRNIRKRHVTDDKPFHATEPVALGGSPGRPFAG